MILVPVKNLSGAKQRLAALFDQPTRTELAQAMLFDVLETLGTWAERPEVSIVTSDPFAFQLASQFHFSVIPDMANRSQTDAIEMATRFCESRGVDSTLVIPGDIPLVQSWELQKVVRSAPAQGSVLVRAGGWTRHERDPAAARRAVSRALRQRQFWTSLCGGAGHRQTLRRPLPTRHRARRGHAGRFAGPGPRPRQYPGPTAGPAMATVRSPRSCK